MKLFVVWEVFGMSDSREKLLARFPFKCEKEAKAYATTTRGYCVRGKVEQPQDMCQFIAQPDATRVRVLPPAKASVAPAPAPAPIFKVWDDVNNRYVTADGLSGSPDATFTTRESAEAYATRLNTFGGYGGWMSLRFIVR